MRDKKYDCNICKKKNICKYIDDMARINMKILDIIEQENNIHINHIITKCTEYEENVKTRGL